MKIMDSDWDALRAWSIWCDHSSSCYQHSV